MSDNVPFEALQVKEIVLQRMEVGLSAALDPAVLHGAVLDVVAQHMYGTLTYRLRGYLLAEKYADDTYTATEVVPATWRDARRQERLDAVRQWPTLGWRRRVRLGWACLRWWRDLRRPVATRDVTLTVQVETYKTHPEAHIALPEDLGPVRILQQVREQVRRFGTPDHEWD